MTNVPVYFVLGGATNNLVLPNHYQQTL